MTPGDRGELENEEDSEGTNNTKDKERSSRWKRNPRKEDKEETGRSRSRNPATTNNSAHNQQVKKKTLKGNRSDPDNDSRHFLHMTQTQKGAAKASEQVNNEEK